MTRYHLDVGRLYGALDRRRQLRGLNWAQVGVETDLPGSFFTRISHGYAPSSHALCTLLAWLGEGHAVAFASEVPRGTD